MLPLFALRQLDVYQFGDAGGCLVKRVYQKRGPVGCGCFQFSQLFDGQAVVRGDGGSDCGWLVLGSAEKVVYLIADNGAVGSLSFRVKKQRLFERVQLVVYCRGFIPCGADLRQIVVKGQAGAIEGADCVVV